jgi:uncharacterized protein (DUF4415 family)
MKKSGHIVRYSAEEIGGKLARGDSETDWARVDTMPQAEVERLADEEDGPLPEGWEQSIFVGPPTAKRDIHIRLDADILDWFKAHGKGYQTRINTVLRAFVQARQSADSGEAVRKKLDTVGFTESDVDNAVDWVRKSRR